MSRHFYILLCMFMMTVSVSAQRGLHIDGVLDGRYRKHPNTTDIVIRGSQLDEFRLDYYHSLTVVNDAAIMNAVASAFKADEQEAQDKEVVHVGQQLYYGFYQLRPNGETNRYVFFKDQRCASGKKAQRVTLIYMEGWASLAFLKKKFKK